MLGILSWEQRLRQNVTVILRDWQNEARTRWPQYRALLAPEGVAYECAMTTLSLLVILPLQEKEDQESLSSGRVVSEGAPSLRECVGAWSALPLTWQETREMRCLLEHQVEAFLERQEADAAVMGAVRAVLGQLAAAIADTRILQLERELATDREEALMTQHIAGRFLTNASHELRTPLTAILGFADLLQEETYGELNPEQNKAIGHINDSAQNLLEIVNNLLDLLHIRAGKLTLNYHPVEVAPFLQSLFDLLTALAERKKIQFSLHLTEDLGRIEMDDNIVRHIIYHLLASALRSTPAGGKVTLTAQREPDKLTILTQDTALHLPPEALANMNSPFPLLENSPARGYEGWEVGLPLVRRYIDLHGGTLELESLPEQGTTFRIFLPVRRPNNRAHA